jgi:hypothetical protein
MKNNRWVTLVVVILCSLSTSVFAQHQDYLRGLDFTRSIAKKLGFNGDAFIGLNCKSYSYGQLDQENLLRGDPSFETGKTISNSPDASIVQQFMTDVDACLQVVSSKRAENLAKKIFRPKVLNSFCPNEGPTLCPPVTDINSAKLAIAGQILMVPGYLRVLETIDFSNRIDLQKMMVQDFIEYFVGPDELFKEDYSRKQIAEIKENLRLKLVNKVTSDTISGQGSSGTLLGYMLKSLFITDEFLRINH